MKRPTDQRRTAASSSKLTATGPGPRRIDPLHPTGCEWKANGIEPFILAVFNKLPEKSRCVLFQRILNDCVVGTRWRAPMIRLLFTALLCALASSQATAQNWVSEALLGLNEDQRNERLRSWMTGRCCAEIEIRTRLHHRFRYDRGLARGQVAGAAKGDSAFGDATTAALLQQTRTIPIVRPPLPLPQVVLRGL